MSLEGLHQRRRPIRSKESHGDSELHERSSRKRCVRLGIEDDDTNELLMGTRVNKGTKVDKGTRVYKGTKVEDRPKTKEELGLETLPDLMEMSSQSFLAQYRVRRRLKKHEKFALTLLFFSLLILSMMLYMVLYNFPIVHFHVNRVYAHLGHVEAQHLVGERLLHGHGVDRNETEAMKWFRMASDKGHGKAALNLAVGHLKGLHDDLRRGELRRLIQQAHQNGVQEAEDLLLNLCGNGGCS